ncbi:MAG: phosphoribosylamine--glycine ligase [Bacillota bacterium]
MKVLIIGSGGRESALAWKINQSPKVDKIFVAPGNAGTHKRFKNISIKSNEIDKLLNFAKEEKIDMTVVGPEVPLVKGIVDNFEKNNLKVVGPSSKGALLEGSKSFSKEFMEKYNIPTAKYKEFKSYENAKNALDDFNYPLVIKADGLAGGKGVLIPENKKQAIKDLKTIMLKKKFGDAGNKVIIEEYIDGIEASMLCFVDGKTILPMETAQDYKRAKDGDKGLNTGGMGSYSPSKIIDEKLKQKIDNEVLKPFLKGINQEKIDFKGILFVGLMIKEDELKVLEFNVRFGDPETQVILPRLKNDLYNIFDKMVDQKLDEIELKWKDKSAVCVVLASGGYPVKYKKGYEIKGLKKIDNLFHAGTKFDKGKVYTNGGRVLNVVSVKDTLKEARESVYESIKKIDFKKKYFRKDIAK